MRPGGVVARDPAADTQAGLGTGGVGPQINVFVLQAAPQALHEDVVHAASFAVHADPDAGGFQHAGEGRAGKLRTLVAVEDLRPAVSGDRKSTRLNSSHPSISYAVFCLKKKTQTIRD